MTGPETFKRWSGASNRPSAYLSLSFAAVLATLCFDASAQIGGKTADDGVFILDDVEDLDHSASGVQRTWISTYANNATTFTAVSPGGAGLTVAPGQSSAGALSYPMTSAFGGYSDYSFGVPMPSVLGASTLSSPGNITSFSKLSFLTCYSQAFVNQQLLVVLECYPQTGTVDGNAVFPKAIWSYSAPPGTQFQKITLNLRAPTQIADAGGYTLEQMLAQTRFLAFYYYGGPEPLPKSVTAYVDDIKLEPPVASAGDWTLYE